MANEELDPTQENGATDAPEDRKIRALRITLIVLCVIFGISIVFNMTTVISSWVNPDFPPGMLGLRLVLVNSDSMEGDAQDSIPMHSVVLIRKRDFESHAEGDLIAMSINRQSLIGRVTKIEQDANGEPLYYVLADNMEAYYRDPVTRENYLGEVTRHINWLGAFAKFQNSTAGLILFEGIPWLICIGIVVWEVRLMILARRAARADGETDGEADGETDDTPDTDTP